MILFRSLRTAASLFGASVVLAACGVQDVPNPAGVVSLSPAAPRDQATSGIDDVAYQEDTEHSGYVSAVLRPPLHEVWSVNLGRTSGGVGYPIVANGVIVTTAGGDLVGVNARTGKVLWRQGSPSRNFWIGPAYDNGAVFVDLSDDCSSSEQGLFAFNERTGKELWSAKPPYQCFFSSLPTAASGVVYTAAAGAAGTLYAYKESKGALQWTAQVANGDDSSPVVTSSGVYVSYACPQTYDFNPHTGKKIWHYGGGCSGGGGSTPALYDGLLFVGDSNAFSGYNGLILRAGNGRIAGGFNSYSTPAFAGRLGYFVTSYTYGVETLEARKIPTMRLAWKTMLNGDTYVTPPFVVGNIVYIETKQGNLFGYDTRSGKQKLEMALGYGGSYGGFSVGLGFGSGELVVPNGEKLIALKGS